MKWTPRPTRPGRRGVTAPEVIERYCARVLARGVPLDEMDLRLLALSDPDEAITAATLGGRWDLVREFERMPVNVFASVAKARLTVADAARACRVPPSTAAAAASGRISGGMTHRERVALSKYLRQRLAGLEEAIRLCERRTKL